MEQTLRTKGIRYSVARLRYWLRMLMGRSYFHKPQRIGAVFEPGRLKGYFNDLRAKAEWPGPVDGNGVPVVSLSEGRTIYFPILITQKALGHWDRWLLENRDEDKRQFLFLCDWLTQQQDDSGGWDTWQPLYGESHAKYSAMTQGQALSVFARALTFGNDSRLHRASKSALGILLTSVQRGGVTYFEGDDVFLEETPVKPRNTILNGWIFALFGLYDYNLVQSDREANGLFEQSMKTLIRSIPCYDNGYWSYYDCARNVTSPFYHNLHISQLEALCMIRDEEVFRAYRQRWAGFRDRRANRSRAFLVKAWQKLRQKDEPVLVN